MMFRKMMLILIYMSLVLLNSVSYAAPAVTGCLGLRWGDSLEQADKIMTGQGYKKIIREDLGTGKAVYDGFFAGESAEITFDFMNNQFYRVTAQMVWGAQMGRQQEMVFIKAENILTSKYGPPNKTIFEPESRLSNTAVTLGAKSYAMWDLTAGDNGDSVTITLFKQIGTFGEWGSRPGFVQAEYTNRSLEQRLNYEGI
jgi:hypothetical protein